MGNDLLICELQHENEILVNKLNSINEVLDFAADPTHNPAALSKEIITLRKEGKI